MMGWTSLDLATSSDVFHSHYPYIWDEETSEEDAKGTSEPGRATDVGLPQKVGPLRGDPFTECPIANMLPPATINATNVPSLTSRLPIITMAIARRGPPMTPTILQASASLTFSHSKRSNVLHANNPMPPDATKESAYVNANVIVEERLLRRASSILNQNRKVNTVGVH